MFLQLSWIGPFWANRAYLHLGTPKEQEVFFGKLTQFTMGNNALDILTLTNVVFFREVHVFLHLSRICLSGIKRGYLHLVTPKCRMYSFQKLTHFSQRNNVVDANASKTDGCLWRDTCASSTQLNMCIWSKMSLSLPWKLWYYMILWKYCFQKLTKLSLGNSVLDALPSNTGGFLWEIHVFLQLN
jgi:hypothetical protein